MSARPLAAERKVSTSAERTGSWLAPPPSPFSPLRAAVVRALFRRVVASLPVRVTLPDGETIGAAAGAATMRIHSNAFFHRVGRDALIGFGESYMAGEWDADDLAATLTPFAARMGTLVPAWMQRLRRWYLRYHPEHVRNTPERARDNVSHHYDLSNELFALFLDESMTYSSALFAAGDNLEAAQVRKIDRILDAARVGVGTRVLEIGTGWGALAVRAARRGAHVTTVTLSRRQYEAARARVARAGVSSRVEVRLSDYRHVDGLFDAVVSVEMIESVGAPHWPEFFSTLDRVLARGGVVALQAIVLPHQRMLATLNQYTWMHKYIFPGGALPSVPAIVALARDHTTLEVRDCFAFGSSYAATLRAWRARFVSREASVDALGFDRVFRRMWEFYLAYCEAGFAAGYIDVVQVVLDRERR